MQQAYKELARQGIAVSRPGQGTRIGSAPVEASDATPLRRATDGAPGRSVPAGDAVRRLHDREIESGFPREPGPLARAGSGDACRRPLTSLRFAGSHDPAVSLVAARFGELVRLHCCR